MSYSTKPKFCERCGAGNNRRVINARFCFPCAAQRPKETGAYRAHAEVKKAIARGELPRADTLNCDDCGNPARDWDHRDYNKPLEVRPVCRSCNKLRGPAIHVLVLDTKAVA